VDAGESENDDVQDIGDSGYQVSDRQEFNESHEFSNEHITVEQEEASAGVVESSDEVSDTNQEDNESDKESEPPRPILIPSRVVNVPTPRPPSGYRPPPPSRVLPSANEEGEPNTGHVRSPPRRSIPPPPRAVPRPPQDPEEDESEPIPVPHPRRVSVPPPSPVNVRLPEEELVDDESDEAEDQEEEALPPPTPVRPIPPPRLHGNVSDADSVDSVAPTPIPPPPVRRPLPRASVSLIHSGVTAAATSPLLQPSHVSGEVLDESEGGKFSSSSC
jgi:hypothetical protein